VQVCSHSERPWTWDSALGRDSLASRTRRECDAAHAEMLIACDRNATSGVDSEPRGRCNEQVLAQIPLRLLLDDGIVASGNQLDAQALDVFLVAKRANLHVEQFVGGHTVGGENGVVFLL